jgi:Uma2 family endonuclease
MDLEMVTFVDAEIGEFNVPSWVRDLASFRRWVEFDETLDFGRVGFLKGRVWIDMSKEQLFTHNQVKTKLTVVLDGLVESNDLGFYFCDGALLSSVPADLSGQPDGMFVSNESLASGRVRVIEGKRDGGYVELEGAPDLVIEVVSKSSVKKDKVQLRTAYWEAGVREYWLIDARAEEPTFDLLRYTARGYVASRKPEGWVRSAVLSRSFRLTRRTTRRNFPVFTLEMRD